MCYIICIMKKNGNYKEVYITLSLMVLILIGFVAYRVGPFPTIPLYRWHGLNKARNVSETVSIEPTELSYNLMLISPDYPLDESQIPNISEYRSTGVLMASSITEHYGLLSDYIRENLNNTLYIESSYRSFEDQQRVYNEEGPEIAAVPGCSEHQSGLALDVYVMYFGGSAFINSDVGKFVNTNCGDFGFIIRYPNGAEEITGFKYEPWHIRYVGFPHSRIIMNAGITLEEYIDSLKIGVWYSYDNYLICRQEIDSLCVPSQYADCSYEVSPDNTGYYIVTVDVGD